MATISPATRAAVPPAVLLAVLAALAAHGAAQAPPAAAPREPAASTREMAALLQERAAMVDPMALPLLVNDRRAELAARRLAQPLALHDRLRLRSMAAVELIQAGRNEDALAALAALAEDARANAPHDWRQYQSGARMLEAMAHLRIAEEQNCCAGNNRDSCLLPIRGAGIHTRREGATRAAAVLEAVLAAEPENLRARWLLNVAHMTLGSYPDGVPAAQRIPPAAFAPEHPLPRFDNVAAEVGLDIFALAGGAILEDFDGDARLDLMTSAMGLADPLRLFHNRGDGSFEERGEAAGLAGEVGGLNLASADYDNDGDVDVLVLRGGWMGSEGRFPLSLLRNDGDGGFTDVTRAAGLLRFAPTQTAAWLDYDGDGRLDLFVGNESSPGLEHPCELFHNDGGGTFSERARASGVDVAAFVKGVASGDYDNDGRPDLYVSVLGGDNLLFHNDGPAGPAGAWRFSNAAAAAGVTEPRGSFGTFFFDYDNDGWLDLFVAGYGLVMAEHVAADYLGLPTDAERGRLYRNRGDGRFEDVTRAAGLYRVVPAMGLGFGDLDNDGDQDVFEQMGGAYLADKAHSVLYQNPGNPNRWLGLELEGVRSNRRALGARLTLAVETAAGPRRIHRMVGTGGSFGASPLRQEIGLGDARRVSWLEIRWPGGGLERVEGLQPGRRYRIREGSRAAVEVEWPRDRRSGPGPQAE